MVDSVGIIALESLRMQIFRQRRLIAMSVWKIKPLPKRTFSWWKCLAHSRFYRRRISQSNIRWRALDEIYQIKDLLHLSNCKFEVNFLKRRHFQDYKWKMQHVSTFAVMIAYFVEIFSMFFRFSRKRRKTLQLLSKFSYFNLIFIMITEYTEMYSITIAGSI